MIIYPNGSFITQDNLKNINFADVEYKDKVLLIDDNSDIAKNILLGRKFKVISKGDKVESITLSTEEVIPQVSELEQLKVEVAELKKLVEANTLQVGLVKQI